MAFVCKNEHRIYTPAYPALPGMVLLIMYVYIRYLDDI